MKKNLWLRKKSFIPVLHLALAIFLLAGLVAIVPSTTVSAATLLDANFNTDANGFIYQDDAFGTSQPSYADGVRDASAGFAGSGGLKVTLGGVNSTAINGMSGGWSYTLNLAAAETGVSLSFRYKLGQSATYEYDEYSRALVKVDGVQYGRGAKNYVDHVGGDGSSSQGNSSSYLPTTDWQQVTIFLGNLSAGSHPLVIGALNNKKDASDETTTLVIDDVLVTSGNPAPLQSDAQQIVERVDINQFLGYLQGIAQFDDRCRGSGMSCTSYDSSANPSSTSNYMKALSWVESQLQAMGYTTVRHTFTSNTGGVNLYATKLGSVTPTEMYMVSAHLDARSGGDGFDDDGSGVALVLEIARVLAAADVTTDKSVRFIFWDKEETGLNGSAAYASNDTASGGRRALQGTLEEPTWLGIIQHDMVLYDHGAGSVTTQQSAYADLDVEWRAGTTKEADSKALALKWAFVSGLYAPDYPATAYNYSTNTDDTSFHPYVASISVRENRRSLTSDVNKEWINPYYHTVNDIETSYTRDDDGDGKRDDIELGVNAVKVTLGLVAELAVARIASANNPPTANPQSVSTNEDTAEAITLTGSDPDSDPLTFQVTASPAHGTLSGTAPNLTYTPAANYNGPDSFQFVVNDGSVDSPPATVSITVNPVNDPPVADAQSVSTVCQTPAAITLTGSDVDGDALTFTVTVSPVHGTLSGSPPSLTYTPFVGYNGEDQFSFVTHDGQVNSLPAVVSLSVSGCTTPLPLPFMDDFETDRGWVVNPGGTDNASSGQWERADPQATSSNGPKQLGVTTSEVTNLVTGALAGKNAASYDLDGGITTVRSPLIQLPTGQDITLSLQYYLAHGKNASSADFLRLKVVGQGSATLLELRGTNQEVNAAWETFSASLNSFAGQVIYLQAEAVDGSKDSLVEAALDDVSIVATTSSTAILEEHFDSGVGAFSYLDDAFRATSQPLYADGSYQAAGGYSGGGLQVILGGVDDEIVTDISGGWQSSFNLAAPTAVRLSFWFKLTQSPDYESDETSQALVSLDGVLYGLGTHDYLAVIYGNGNGGISETTGWQLCTLDLGILPAGSHTLVIGGYNNQKTYNNEFSQVLIDDILLADY